MKIIFDKSLLGVNIKYLRKQKKLTQGALCDIIGSKPTTLSNWEIGFSTPDLDILVKLSNYFGIDLDSLILVPYNEWSKEKRGDIDKECSFCREKERTIAALLDSNSYLKEMLDQYKNTLLSGKTGIS